MKRLIFLAILMACLTVTAQELKVVSMECTNDIVTADKQRRDLVGDPCAVVKVQLPVQGVRFEGSIVGEPVFNVNTYWVYMPLGSRELEVNCPGHYTTTINFPDYGIPALESKRVYVLRLEPTVSVSAPEQSQSALGLTTRQYLILHVTPANASVEVDGESQVVDNGTVKCSLRPGVHTCHISAPGYSSEDMRLTIGDQRVERSVDLKSSLAHIMIQTEDKGVDIYVNDEYRGTDSWSGNLVPGEYIIEGRQKGYKSKPQSVNLGVRENRTVRISGLQPVYGAINVDYDPFDAEVWIDGERVGTSPNVFPRQLVGQHTVTIKKDGYRVSTLSVQVSEGQEAYVNGKLEEGFVPGMPQTFTVKNVTFRMMPVRGGSFTMGATYGHANDANSDEKPAHPVTLSDYMIGQTEVTQELWYAVMGNKPSKTVGPTLPVENVSWDDCQEFIRRLNELTGLNFRLPTEAEWEYAARGGTLTNGHKYSGTTESLKDYAWYDENCKKPQNVATKRPNELGLYDMSGNVWEWCADWYGPYSGEPATNPVGPEKGQKHVIRGGGWDINPRYCRVCTRVDFDGMHNNTGLRLAL